MRVWREWALRQVIVYHNLAARARWREQAFQAALHGVDLGAEPEWDLAPAKGTTGADPHEAEFQALKERMRKRGR